MKKILIFTDSDLDGAGSALALKWVLPSNYNIKIIPTTVSKFRNELLDWLKTDKLSKKRPKVKVNVSKKLASIVFTSAKANSVHVIQARLIIRVSALNSNPPISI